MFHMQENTINQKKENNLPTEKPERSLAGSLEYKHITTVRCAKEGEYTSY